MPKGTQGVQMTPIEATWVSKCSTKVALREYLAPIPATWGFENCRAFRIVFVDEFRCGIYRHSEKQNSVNKHEDTALETWRVFCLVVFEKFWNIIRKQSLTNNCAGTLPPPGGFL